MCVRYGVFARMYTCLYWFILRFIHVFTFARVQCPRAGGYILSVGVGLVLHDLVTGRRALWFGWYVPARLAHVRKRLLVQYGA